MLIFIHFGFVVSKLFSSYTAKANTLQKPFYSFLPMGPSGHEVDADEEDDNTVNGVDTRLKL